MDLYYKFTKLKRQKNAVMPAAYHQEMANYITHSSIFK